MSGFRTFVAYPTNGLKGVPPLYTDTQLCFTLSNQIELIRGGSMVAPFDIFKVDEPDGMLWIEAAAELEVAKARVAALMRATPCEYLIFSQQTGHKISIKPTNGNGNPASE